MKIGKTVKIAYVDQSRARSGTTKPCSTTSPAARHPARSASYEMPSRAYIGRFNFKGGDQQKSSATSPAVNAVVCIWPKR